MNGELAFRFFREFSLLEYALKKAGFVKAAGGSRAFAQTDWQKFRADLAESFSERSTEHADLKRAIEYLQEAPPKYLRCSEEQLDWSETEVQDESLEQILRAVQTVRNNLFHGDKATSMGESEVGRDERLVRCSLTVLEHCIQLDERAREYYEEARAVAH